MEKTLQQLEQEREQFDKDSQRFIDSLRFADKQIGQLNSMKQSEGWTLLADKMREELLQRIRTLVEKDAQVQTL